ncbi:MAG: PGF-CTERM sorting domain-containing protein [Candidatus Methanoperedens sp.]|nr:PGF-CTERM sorting domain-containing protein [Candidatus Methanoperedens sp.]
MTKKILAVVLAVFMLLVVAFPVSAAVQATKVEVRGSVWNQGDNLTDASWNSQKFAGFYYDLKNNLTTERLDFLAAPDRSNPEDTIRYRTGIVPVDFKVYEKEGLYVTNTSGVRATNYSVVGWQAEKWVAVNPTNVAKIAKLALEMDKEEKRTLTTGETWSLGAGYEININAIDARTTPRQAWFTLKKDGAVIDEGIAQAPGTSGKQPAVYYKTKTILGESDALLFTVYVDNIFSGATSDMVQFKYAWLIDESTAKEIKSADQYGVFEVRGTTGTINMTNKNSVSLSSNSDTTLMGNLKFRVADNSSFLRFYPFVEYTAPGTYEVRGAVWNEGDGTAAASWNSQKFAGFYYDLKNNLTTERLDFLAAPGRSNPEDTIRYRTGIVPVDFKVYEKEGLYVTNTSGVRATNYSVVGWQAEKWVAVNPTNVAKIAKLALEMDKEEKRTLTTGETWSLGAGYEININAIDARTTPRQAWFTLKKDGAVIDEGIAQAPGTSGKQPAVYYKTKTILGESDALLFTVYVDNIFSGATSDMVQFKYAWLIDESTAKEIKSADQYGVFEVRGTTGTINMTNKNSVSLSSNSETTLMGELKFKIADNSSTLRFYPKIDYVVGNGTTVTTGTAVTTPRGTVRATPGATATLTVVPTTPKPAETGVAETPKPAATTPTEPGFELVFAVAGLLAVAYLVLRQRK